ncbi:MULTISPECIES: CHAT domain-containing protein [unclassified Micromonospora]|uniref:CHAT domain-containing protein n=1 Tax=unclassified Micromonospora TaxID=2617518 RepID=UPI00098D1AA0|nr:MULTISPECIES: CHAT domain-containing protein [unclassified Micromonospora]MDI5936699.1 hypothetical protein [Micromonospora sp. DH15]OON32047.1 hypothetical protein BSA16_07630 [Micromonospora sp. Rc5]
MREWDLPARVSSSGVLRLLILRRGDDHAAILQSADAMLADLNAVPSELVPAQVIAVWRLAAVLDAVAVARCRGELLMAWSWLVRGLGGEAELPASHYTTEGLNLLIEESRHGEVTSQDILAGVAEHLFDLATNFGYLPELMDSHGELIGATLLLSEPSEAALAAAPMALTWARQRGNQKLATLTAQWCVAAAGKPDADPVVAARLLHAAALTLPDAASRRQVINNLLGSLPSDAPGLLRLQLLVDSVEGDFDLVSTRLPILLDHMPRLWAEHPDDVVPLLREHFFRALGPVITVLAEHGRVGDCVRLLRAWNGQPPGRPADPVEDAVLLVIDQPDGMRWSWSGGSTLMPLGMSLAKLTDTMNAALGTSYQVVGGGKRQLRAARDHLDSAASAAFAAACRRYFRVDLPEPARTAVSARSLAIFLPGTRIPHQAFILPRWIPPMLWASLNSPLPDRWLDRVVLLEGDTDLACTEASLVTALLSQLGCQVERVAASEVTPARFEAAYTDASADAIWLIGHGRSPMFQPQHSHLALPGGDTVGIDLLLRRPPAPFRRRLLVLNVCEGAVTAVTGGPSRRGLAGAAADASQAVMAHQWEINERAAACFGVLLAASLLDHPDDYRAGFGAAMARFRRPWAEIEQLLLDRGCPPAEVERLSPVVDFADQFFHYAAPALFA